MFHCVKTRTVKEKMPLNLLSQEEKQWNYEEQQPLNVILWRDADNLSTLLTFFKILSNEYTTECFMI